MNDLEEKTKEWEKLKEIQRLTMKTVDLEKRKEYFKDFYNGIRAYCEKYKTRFNNNYSPMEESLNSWRKEE